MWFQEIGFNLDHINLDTSAKVDPASRGTNAKEKKEGVNLEII